MGPESEEEVMTASGPMTPVPYRIERIWRETHDTFTFELVPADGSAPMAFLPGQFNMLYVFGVGEVPISISGDPSGPAGRRMLVHTTRAVGNVTKAMQRLRRGDWIGVRGPYGAPWPVEEARGNDVVIAAGGIGIAPLRPVIYHVFANRERYGSLVVLYGARSAADVLYRRELERWRSRFDVDVQVTVDRSDGGWRGNVGFVTTLVRRAHFDPLNTTAMICGPEVMMRFTALELQTRGLDAEHIYYSVERKMKCAVRLCGFCQLGPTFVCQDGPVFRSDVIGPWLERREA
jgi:NAD(P)H-flavin reductase